MKATAYPVGALQGYRYVVTFARHQGRWLFCRHRQRHTWEASGGHIEPGETPLEAARRELYEETGALSFDIRPICDYWACDEPHEHYPIDWSNGQVFLADIHELGPLPDSEMQEARLFDSLPERLTYPDIVAVLIPMLPDGLSASLSRNAGITLRRLEQPFSVCKLGSAEGIDLQKPYTFFARTEDELSLACAPEDIPPGALAVEPDWRAMKIEGELDFSLTGILAGIASALAGAGISLFAVSTYNTDYILIKAREFDRAAGVLRAAGYGMI